LDSLLGRFIIRARTMTYDEIERAGLPSERLPSVLVLDNGAVLFMCPLTYEFRTLRD
jgi:hypothetical protein